MATPKPLATSGTSVQPGAEYPREVEPPPGLPAGWKAIEYAYKTGNYVGKTYVRYNSPLKKDNLCTIKKAIEKHAMNEGLSEKEAAKLVDEHERKMQEKKLLGKLKQEENGFVRVDKREEAIAAFRAKYGPLDGATVTLLDGWRAESVFRDSCQQLAVTYYSPEGRPFGTVKGVEAMFGVRVLQGQDVPEVDAARAKVKMDEYGRPINEARQDPAAMRSADDVPATKEKKKEHAKDATPHKRQRVVPPESYVESPSLTLMRVPATAANDEEAKLPPELRGDSVAILQLLTERGFQADTELLALQGRSEGHELARLLQGVFHARPDKYNGRPYFQQTLRHASGAVVCRGVYVFWSQGRERWKIGPLDDDVAPYAYLPGDRARPTDAGEKPWMVYFEAPTEPTQLQLEQQPQQQQPEPQPEQQQQQPLPPAPPPQGEISVA